MYSNTQREQAARQSRTESGFLHYLFGVNQPNSSSDLLAESSRNAQNQQQRGKRLSSPVRAMAPKREQTYSYPDDDLMSMTLSKMDLEQPPDAIGENNYLSEKEEMETELISTESPCSRKGT